MSETDTTPEPDRHLPLTPLDEARVARAELLQRIANAALDDLPVADEHDPVGGALNLLRLAEELTARAVILRREQGASWKEIGQEAGITRQAAWEKWGDAVEGWAMIDRHRQDGSHLAAHQLDCWYAEIDPERPDAVSSGLPSLHDRAARAAAQNRREEARRLHAELDSYPELEKNAFNRTFEALGTPEHPARRMEWAAVHLGKAAVLDRLAEAEPLAAATHRLYAGRHRTLAQDIAAGKAPAEATALVKGH